MDNQQPMNNNMPPEYFQSQQQYYAPQEPRLDEATVDAFLLSMKDKLEVGDRMILRDRLLQAPASKLRLLHSVDYKEPTTLLVISILLGGWGIDRFMLGDIGMGVLKLLTGGLCGILTIIDWCTIMKKAKKQNFEEILSLL